MKKHVMSMSEFLNENEQPKKFDRELHKNWNFSYEDDEHIEKILATNKKSMDELKNRIEQDLKAGKSLEKWIWGYVINRGGSKGMDIESVCYGKRPTKDQYKSFALVEVVGGGLHWVIYDNENIMAGGSIELRDKGIELYRKLKDIKGE